MKVNQKGFGVVQILLLVLLVGMIVGTGFYVYRAQKDMESKNNASNEEQQINQNQNKQQSEVSPANEEDSWLLFEPSDKAYSVRVPDGWQGISIENNLFVRGPAKMVYVKGTKATVELTEGGWDGPSPFALYLPRQNYDQIVREGTKQGEIKTDQGLTVEKYLYIETEEPEVIGYEKGDTVYNYYFNADGKYIQVTHYFSTGGTDQHETVERLIKAIEVK